jgi:hypothetical protein
MHGPAAIRLLELLPATLWLAWISRRLRLVPLLTLGNRFLGKIRKPLGRFFPDPRVPRRWPSASSNLDDAAAPTGRDV